MQRLLTLLLISAAQVRGLHPHSASPCRARRQHAPAARATAACGLFDLVFPRDDSPAGRDEQGQWRKGKLPESDVTYWWRNSDGGEPEIAVSAPEGEWKVGTLDDGREYFWREGSDPDDPEIRLPGSAQDGGERWRIGVLESGRRYMWRGNGDDTDVRLWEQSSLDSGKPFWYTADGAVSLTDPFDLESGYTEL